MEGNKEVLTRIISTKSNTIFAININTVSRLIPPSSVAIRLDIGSLPYPGH